MYSRRVIEELSASGDSELSASGDDGTGESDSKQLEKKKRLKYALLFYLLYSGIVTYRKILESDSVCDSDEDSGEKYVFISCLV